MYTKTWRAVDCKCRPSTVRTVELCCCRAPTRYLKSCVGNVIVRRRTRYTRSGANCNPVIERRQTIVPCRVGVVIRTRMGKCNPRSCKKLVTRSYERRSGCTCIPFQVKREVTCCCAPDRTRTVCMKNTDVVRITVSHRFVNNNCMPKTTRTTMRVIPRKYTLV